MKIYVDGKDKATRNLIQSFAEGDYKKITSIDCNPSTTDIRIVYEE